MWPMLLLSGAHLAGTAHRCRTRIRGGGVAELEHSLPVHFRVHFRDGASCHRTAVLGAASSLLGPPLGDMGFLTAWQLGPKRGQLGRTGRKLLRTAQPLRPPSAPSLWSPGCPIQGEDPRGPGCLRGASASSCEASVWRHRGPGDPVHTCLTPATRQ